ncbi:hypothetical protein BGP77_15340 [Saccharospirillum sp. MSK14-1]|nr:hypothetical protein BGP77_15340 [Saccharospirillum sp. MSK14-1]
MDNVILVLATVVTIQGCGLQYFGRVPPPEGSQWSKDGFQLQEAQDFMFEFCWASGTEGIRTDQDMINTHECMLAHDFHFLEDPYDVVELGYAPFNKSICTKNPDRFMYSTPGCKSYREKHPDSLNWLRRLLD